MKTIKLHMKHMKTPENMHKYLAKEFNFPAYYGANLDALYDCLTDIQHETHVEMPHEITCEETGLGGYGELVCKVFEQAAQQDDHLQFTVVI